MRRSRLASLALATLLAACAGGGEDNNLSAIDNELIADNVDPALTSALNDPIATDETLATQANPNTARPPETPVQAQYPADANPGEAVGSARQTGGGPAQPPSAARCGRPFEYGLAWAQRLPAEFPAYPGGRVTEAAGNDHGGCRLRVVVFATGDGPARVLAHYRALAVRGGYSAEQQQRGGDRILGGARGDAAYYLIVSPLGAGAEVSLIVDSGR